MDNKDKLQKVKEFIESKIKYDSISLDRAKDKLDAIAGHFYTGRLEGYNEVLCILKDEGLI
ncbi:MAG: hypothetical protein KGO96_07525 [Elusimicrobia bacterium]|nr:hypothetical protein [Elusimicrobiota bacterium]